MVRGCGEARPAVCCLQSWASCAVLAQTQSVERTQEPSLGDTTIEWAQEPSLGDTTVEWTQDHSLWNPTMGWDHVVDPGRLLEELQNPELGEAVSGWLVERPGIQRRRYRWSASVGVWATTTGCSREGRRPVTRPNKGEDGRDSRAARLLQRSSRAWGQVHTTVQMRQR